MNKVRKVEDVIFDMVEECIEATERLESADGPRLTARARDSQTVRSRWVSLLFSRPVLRLGVLGLGVVGLGAVIASCAGDRQAEPTIESIDFTPRLLVSVDDTGFTVAKGDTDNPLITADPASAPVGTLIEIRNAGSVDHRVTNEAATDTGVMQPGDNTTVVLATEGDLELRDDASGATLKITVTPRSA
jgi:hypothetical protein